MDLVIGRFTLREDGAQAWDEAFRQRVEEAASAPGWMGAALCVPQGADLERVVVGRWRDRADYEVWTATPSYQRTQERMAPHQAGAPVVDWFRIPFQLGLDGGG